MYLALFTVSNILEFSLLLKSPTLLDLPLSRKVISEPAVTNLEELLLPFVTSAADFKKLFVLNVQN